MPSTPTTKSQVQAYRFVLRRMQSALVRKDAVMLHDPMRTHTRATIVGVCLAGLGLLGFLIWGILAPKPTAPTKDGIVIGKPSGQVYVLVAQPQRKLIPVFNLASARLLLQARKEGGDEKSNPVGNAEGPGSGGGAVKVEAPKVVDDNELRDIPKDRKVGIPDGPDLLPSADQRVGPPWTVCDEAQLNRDLPDPDENQPDRKNAETTVMAGVSDLGAQLAQNESLLVRLDVEAPGQSPDDQRAYLVYRTPGTANLPNTSAVRAEVDLSRDDVTTALGLERAEPREISVGLLNAIPEKAALATPDIDSLGNASRVDDLDEFGIVRNGEVFQVDRAGETSRFYVLQRDGIEEVKQTTAELLRYHDNPGAPEITAVTPDAITNIRQVNNIDDSTFPERNTEVLAAENFPVACLSWRTVGEGDNREARTAVHIGKTVPGRPTPVRISSPSADGVRIDYFYMPPGRGAVVRQATSNADFDTGQITLISDRGVKYGVPDATTAAALGLDNQLPAPQNIIQLLPDGASLSVDDVEQSFDSVPYDRGEYPTESEQARPQGGG
ncbi:type VII secretion protein EccB [Actinophytocola xanthii]|uniref:Type VII secretion protein EccB n=1 Tax=Actinophytocola xanthii TaxID=1912961 RepID=A0A1Q8CQ07_9PSEU|nr:type VII secretion protein EccB [Actinophytocola xanthii]OLF16428.1 type VII secretion protein EccB [Actinophytocola xanthii]